MSEAGGESIETESPQRLLLDRMAPLLDRTAPLLTLFLLVGLVVFIAAFLTVYTRVLEPPPPGSPVGQYTQSLLFNGGSVRSHTVLTHWLDEGYFHYCGLIVRTLPTDKTQIYRSSTGGYMVSGFLVEKLYEMFAGHYSWRLLGIHNELIPLLLSALIGLLVFRICRRIGLDARLAFTAGVAVEIVVFTFPDNLWLYYEMTPQAYFLIFPTIFLLIEERCFDGGRTAMHSVIQAVAAFLMFYVESVASLAFLSAMVLTHVVLEQRRGSWKRFIFLALIPSLAALMLYGLQLKIAQKRFPETQLVGGSFMFRSGLNGESRYYGDHLDLAFRRDVARNNWLVNREYLFRWQWVFILGTCATVAMIAAYIAGRLPRIALEVLAWLIGTWLLAAAVFSQAFVIHPYLFDVLLFVPLAVALFGFAPALAESLTRRSGAILLVAVLCAIWYALFQLRLYALRNPMPDAVPENPARQSILHEPSLMNAVRTS